ncbi:MAG: gamma-glutamyltransferase family protein [bacterium]
MNCSWNFPYASQRSPVFARNTVATSQPLAAQAGVQMLLKGGNAVDAALATAITLTVVEPTSNGIGSDAFAIVWDGQTLHGLNGSGRSPRAWSPERFAGQESMPMVGWDTVTVPGAVDVWSTLSERFGRLPFRELFEPALHYADEGFHVSPGIAAQWSQAAHFFEDSPDFVETFLPEGRAPRAGELVRFPHHTRTLAEIAATAGASFYRGKLARQTAAHAAATGGAMTLEDLAEHTSEWVETIALPYLDVQVHELPPNGQGLAALIALGLLQHCEIANYPVDSPDSIHLQVEAMKIAFAEAHRHIADPAHMAIHPHALLDETFLAHRAREIHPDRARVPAASIPREKGTVYLTTADEQGMMVSFIQSNYCGFGSGIVVPGTGISLQNRGSCFTLQEGHPNRVAGGKRPYHTTIPAFVMKAGQPLMSFGVMGGHMQPQGHVQVVLRIFLYQQNPQAALDAPRWHVTEDFRLALEPGFDPLEVTELKRRGHSIVENPPAGLFGGGQIITRLEDGYCAASDPRKDGQPVGF